MKITLAPIPFYWPKQTVLDFYESAKTWPVDRIVLGETVCSKRRELRTADWLGIARDLKAAGKDVVISTLALLESESELKTINTICKQTEFEVEANDLAAVEALFKQGIQFSAGPYLNLYNSQSLKLLEGDGLKRWTLPVELGREELAELLTAIKQEGLALATEVMVHGYLPLALSARCFTARAVDLPKDECGKICIDYPVGIPVSTQEDQRLFTMNGIQTLSGDILDLMPALPEIEAMGVDAVRIVPSQIDMGNIIEAYRTAINGDLINGKHMETAPPSSSNYCDGYWYGEPGFNRAGLPQR